MTDRWIDLMRDEREGGRVGEKEGKRKKRKEERGEKEIDKWKWISGPGRKSKAYVFNSPFFSFHLREICLSPLPSHTRLSVTKSFFLLD